KFNKTKTYLGKKDVNKISILNILNKPYLLLYPYIIFLLLAFLYNAFLALDLTPKQLYKLKVPPS
ncbi:hypothetical protein V2W45_1234295, partial [Cenococcum geophilum]